METGGAHVRTKPTSAIICSRFFRSWNEKCGRLGITACFSSILGLAQDPCSTLVRNGTTAESKWRKWRVNSKITLFEVVLLFIQPCKQYIVVPLETIQRFFEPLLEPGWTCLVAIVFSFDWNALPEIGCHVEPFFWLPNITWTCFAGLPRWLLCFADVEPYYTYNCCIFFHPPASRSSWTAVKAWEGRRNKVDD